MSLSLFYEHHVIDQSMHNQINLCFSCYSDVHLLSIVPDILALDCEGQVWTKLRRVACGKVKTTTCSNGQIDWELGRLGSVGNIGN